MITLQDDQLANETFYEAILDGSPNMIKAAETDINDFTRLKLREDGIVRRVLPEQTVTDTDLDRQYQTSLPCKVVDMESDSPAAITAPFAKTPDQIFVSGQRYLVTFCRILSPWFAADVNQLRTYVMDIRQVISDNSLKDMLAEEDAGFIAGADAIMGGAAGTVNPITGVTQWQQMPGAISRVAWNAGKAIMPTMDGHLQPEKALLNNVTIYQLENWGRDEMGGDISEDVVRNGWTIRQFGGLELIVSLKRNLIPDGTIDFYGNPQFMGKFYTLDTTTMFIERRNYMLSWFSYECIGLTLANPYPFVRVDYNYAG